LTLDKTMTTPIVKRLVLSVDIFFCMTLYIVHSCFEPVVDVAADCNMAGLNMISIDVSNWTELC